MSGGRWRGDEAKGRVWEARSLHLELEPLNTGSARDLGCSALQPEGGVRGRVRVQKQQQRGPELGAVRAVGIGAATGLGVRERYHHV